MRKIFLLLFNVFLVLILTAGCSGLPAFSDVAETETAQTSTAASAVTETQTEAVSQTAPETSTQTTTAAAPQTEKRSAPPVSDATAAAQTSASASETAESSRTLPTDPPAESRTRKSLADQIRAIQEKYSSPAAKKDPAFFDDAVFIGDSVTMGLRNYVTSQRNKGKSCLGTAAFLCCGSMGYTNATDAVSKDSLHPTYKGRKVTVEEGVFLCGANKAFIMLGMNDFSAYKESKWKEAVLTLLDRIEKQNPSVAVYLQSVTPILDGMEHGRFNNENIRAFNAYLQSVCAERGYTYVDIFGVMCDDTGHLKKAYCGDPQGMGIHMSNTGAAAWVNYLRETFCGTV